MSQVWTRALATVALAGVAAFLSLSPPAPSPPPTASPDQLIAVVDDHARRYSTAVNSMAAGALRPERAAAICKAVPNLAVSGWSGQIESLGSTSNGHGTVTLKVSPRISLISTSRDAIAPGSDLHRRLSAMRPGQSVIFSGTFFRHEDDCLKEESLTVFGGMRTPEFRFRLTDAWPAEPPPAPLPPRASPPAAPPKHQEPQPFVASTPQQEPSSTPPRPPADFRNPEPPYPFESRKSGEEGKVSMRLQVSELGRVTAVDILQSSGHPALDEAARTGVTEWRFAPATRDGVPVPGSVRTAVHFRLKQ